MVEIADIEDEKSLREWLVTRSREGAVWIATRAAMRVLPLYWEWAFTGRERKDDLTPLPFLRCVLISSVAAVRPTENIRSAAASAYAVDANASAGDASAYAACAAVGAANDAAYAADIDAAAILAAAASHAAAAAYAVANDAWIATRTDCAYLESGWMSASPALWPDRDNPIAATWLGVKNRATEPEWAFWITWYQDALAGVKPDWNQLERIALIDRAIWEAGPKAVAAEIDKIKK
ncbi:MAG: hypothetical protein KDK24_11450 [Pseudooceanicola sp.]|nr:hypothetical protein [Pseudooceanicola sp.]